MAQQRGPGGVILGSDLKSSAAGGHLSKAAEASRPPAPLPQRPGASRQQPAPHQSQQKFQQVNTGNSYRAQQPQHQHTASSQQSGGALVSEKQPPISAAQNQPTSREKVILMLLESALPLQFDFTLWFQQELRQQMLRLQEERKLQRLREVLAFALMFYSLSVCYIPYLLYLADTSWITRINLFAGYLRKLMESTFWFEQNGGENLGRPHQVQKVETQNSGGQMSGGQVFGRQGQHAAHHSNFGGRQDVHSNSSRSEAQTGGGQMYVQQGQPPGQQTYFGRRPDAQLGLQDRFAISPQLQGVQTAADPSMKAPLASSLQHSTNSLQLETAHIAQRDLAHPSGAALGSSAPPSRISSVGPVAQSGPGPNGRVSHGARDGAPARPTVLAASDSGLPGRVPAARGGRGSRGGRQAFAQIPAAAEQAAPHGQVPMQQLEGAPSSPSKQGQSAARGASRGRAQNLFGPSRK